MTLAPPPLVPVAGMSISSIIVLWVFCAVLIVCSLIVELSKVSLSVSRPNWLARLAIMPSVISCAWGARIPSPQSLSRIFITSLMLITITHYVF